MTNKIFILVILLTISKFGLTQIWYNYGIELGPSFSQFSKSDSYIESTDRVTIKSNPIISPLIGLTGQLIIKKHLQVSIGLQYQMIGMQYNYHRDGRIPRNNNPALFYYTQDDNEKQLFHKLCIPLIFGYKFKVLKMQSTIFIGYRLNRFITGEYSFKTNFNATIDSEDYKYEYKFNPVNPNETAFTMITYSQQFLIGISTSLGQHITISFYFNKGQIITYSRYMSFGTEDCIGMGFNNSEFGINVTYYLKSLEEMKNKNIEIVD